jgi:hypothetical protein
MLALLGVTKQHFDSSLSDRIIRRLGKLLPFLIRKYSFAGILIITKLLIRWDKVFGKLQI